MGPLFQFLKRTVGFLSLSLILFISFKSSANIHSIKKVAILPPVIKTKYKSLSNLIRKNIKERLDENGRFSILPLEEITKQNISASYKLKPSKVILISEKLNADIIIRTHLKKKKLTMKVYFKNDGQLLWTQNILLLSSKLNPSNLKPSLNKLVDDFLASIPFQTFQILDPLIGKTIYDEGEVRLSKADIRHLQHVKKNDPVQWIEIQRINSKPLYQGGSRINILAKGQIMKIKDKIGVLKINQAKDIKLLKKHTLISFPKEKERLIKTSSLDPENISLNQITNEDLKSIGPKKTKKLLSILLAVGNILAFVLLGF